MVGRDAFVGRFGGQQHAGDTGAGVCPGSNKVKVPHVFAPTVRAEPACLRQAWFKLENETVTVSVDAGGQVHYLVQLRNSSRDAN